MHRAETCINIWVIFCARPHNLCAARLIFPALKQRARVKIIKFGAALLGRSRAFLFLFSFSRPLCPPVTPSTMRDLRRWALPVLSRRRRPLKEKDVLPQLSSAQQPTPAAQEGWNAFENGFVGADSHSQTHSPKNSSLFSSPDNLHSKSPLYTENRSRNLLFSARICDPKLGSCLFLIIFAGPFYIAF